MSDKLTVFQKLSRVLGSDSSSPAYIIDPKSFANLDAKDLEQKKLEAQQTYFLQNQWKKIDNELYQKAVYYEPTRMASYYDYEAMEYCIAGDTKIATPDGFITIKELADKGRDYEFITYAYDHNLKQVVPAMARNAHYTRDEMTYKVIFDDGSHIITTWEHQLMKRDGSFERVMNLTPGESMMPFYRKSFYNNQKYNWIYTCNKDEGTNGWVAEHNLIATWFYGDISENEEVHHIDFNGKNNNPENLKIWDISEHRAYHARLNNEKLWSNPNYRAKMLEVSKRTDNKHRWNGERSGENNPVYFKIPFDLIIEVARTEKTLKKTAKKLNVSYRKIQRDIVNSGYRDWNTFTSAYGIERSKYSTAKAKGEQLQLNHKIVSIEPHGVIPVYDLTVPGYKNFATDTIFSHNTPEIAAALDIFADEATTSNESGRILSIYSESTRIKNELTELFENNLDINTNLTAWARNLCKYGDNFVYNKIVPKKGIVGCIQLPNIEITRTEPGFTPVRNLDQYQEESAVQFHWKDKNITFNSFEVSHFRLTGDDRKLPYGTCLKYDTRVDVEHGVKEIKDINIGDKVWSFDIKTQKRVLSSVLDVINSGTKTNYSINTKHNFIEASEEHKIMIFDGGDFIYKNVLDIKIGDLLVINKNVINPETNTVKIFKEEPSNNKNGWFNSINLLPNVVDYKFARLFGFLLGDGWIGNNRVNFALGEYDDLNDTYIGYLNELTSKPVKILKDKYDRETQAFVDSKMLTYVLENMGFVGKSHEKRIPNWVYELPIPLQKAFIEGLIDADGWATSDQWTTAMHIELANEQLIKDLKILLQRIGYKTGSIRKRKDNGVKKYIDGRELKTKRDSYMITFYDSYNEQIIKYDNPNRISDGYILEPVTKIIETGKYETYDIYVENENHNFYANGIVVHNSMLEKVRRIWKQLLLSEDAMLVYRVTRAPERRVYKVFVGNMDDKDVDAYVDKIANNFKRTNIVNANNGQQDTRYNPLAVDQDYFIPVRDPSLAMPIETLPGACLDLETKIPLLDGRILSLNEIISEWDLGNRDLWVYSCDPNTGKLAPGVVTWAGITRKNTDVMKITLDNGEEIVTTPDHKFVHRTKGFVEAKDLMVNDSLMPFYRREERIKKNTNKYEQIWDSEKGEWVFTHRMVVNFLKNYGLINEFVFNEEYSDKDKKIIHHKNHNRYDNSVGNLVFMNGADHIKYHQSVIKDTIWGDPKLNKEKISKGVKRYLNNLSEVEFNKRMERINNPDTKLKTTTKLLEWNKNEENLKLKGKKISEAYSNERKEKISTITKDKWQDSEYRNRVFSKKQTITFDNYIYNSFVSIFEKSLRADIALETLNSNVDFMNHFKTINSNIRSGITNLNEFTLNHVNKMIKERGFSNFTEWKKSECESRGFTNIRQWKYNVDKISNYNHKIVKIEWLESKMDTGTITVDGNELYHDYHTFALESGVFVKNSNLSEIADIEYIQKKMLAALRVPKAFLGFDESTGEGKNLAILDIRFARAVHRVQKALIQELNKMAIIHLYLKGYEDDLNNFTLSLTTPSTQADILKVQNWKEKIQLYRDAVSDAGNGYAATSMTWAKKEILGMSDDDIKLDIQRQAVEKAGGEEIKMLAETIKQTGLFREIYKAYKINPDDMTSGDEQQTGSEPGSELDAAISGGGGGGMGDIGTDFTTPLDTPDDDIGDVLDTPTSDDEPEETLSERIKNGMDKRRGRITESINKTISEIDKIIKE